MLEVTLLGHASLLVHGEGTVLCDPIFSDHSSGGCNLIDQPRRVSLDRLGLINAVAITHHHSDHYNPLELAKSPGLRAKLFLLPAGSIVARHLGRLGCHAFIEMHAGDWQVFTGLEITAAPSNVPFPEWPLDLCDIECGSRFCRIDVSTDPPSVRPTAPEDSNSSFGIRAHRGNLARILAGELPLEDVQLSGAFRYIYPARAELESVGHRALGPLWLLFTTDG